VRSRRTWCFHARGVSACGLWAGQPEPEEYDADEQARRVFDFLDKVLPASVMARLALLFVALTSCARSSPPPECSPDDLAAEYRAAGQVEAEIALRSLMAQSGDPLDQYNLIVALADGGYPVEVDALRQCVARLAPGDALLPHALVVLADEVDDPDEAARVRAQAEWLNDGQDPEEEGPAPLQAARYAAAARDEPPPRQGRAGAAE
jgi:hypothetical protein